MQLHLFMCSDLKIGFFIQNNHIKIGVHTLNSCEVEHLMQTWCQLIGEGDLIILTCMGNAEHNNILQQEKHY